MKQPLVKTYRIEHVLIEEHNQRYKRAAQTWGAIVCPYCYLPICKCEENTNAKR